MSKLINQTTTTTMSLENSKIKSRIKFIDLIVDKNFCIDINPQKLKDFYLEAFIRCHKLIQQNILRTYTTFPKGIQNENICFIIKKSTKLRVEDMFLQMNARRDKRRKFEILNMIPELKISIGQSMVNRKLFINLVQINKKQEQNQFSEFPDYILIHQYKHFTAKQIEQSTNNCTFYSSLNRFNLQDVSHLLQEKSIQPNSIQQQSVQPVLPVQPVQSVQSVQPQVKTIQTLSDFKDRNKFSILRKEELKCLEKFKKVKVPETDNLTNVVFKLENQVANYKNELLKAKIKIFHQKIKKNYAKTQLIKQEVSELQKKLQIYHQINNKEGDDESTNNSGIYYPYQKQEEPDDNNIENSLNTQESEMTDNIQQNQLIEKYKNIQHYQKIENNDDSLYYQIYKDIENADSSSEE